MIAYAGPTQSELAPDYDQVVRQLVFWFGGCMAGVVEIGWFDAVGGKLNCFRRFDVGDLEACAAFVVETNKVPGQSAYFRPALIVNDAPRFARDEHFGCAPGPWADLDREGAADSASSVYSLCRPNMVIVTGRKPFTRAQLFWRREEPIADAAAVRDLNTRIATQLGGDTHVVNPTSLMRLAGTIAWPWKPGRVPERTELVLFGDQRAKAYVRGAIERAFPVMPTLPAPQPSAASPLNIGTSFLSVDALMARIRAGGEWHNNTLRLVGHWIACGQSDAEILATAEHLTLAGYTADDTRRDMARMIAGGRVKWNKPNLATLIDAPPANDAGALDLMAWTAERYVGEAKPIAWLCQGTIPLAVPALMAAMGGLGKSYLALDLALQIAAGVAGLEQQRHILGGKVVVEGTAVIVTAEDSFDAIHRRLNRIDPTSRRLRHSKRLIVVPMADAGGARPLIASDGKNLTRTDFFEELKRQLLMVPDLRLVVIDPLQAFVMADVNADPAAGQFMWSAMAELAAETKATILVTHHMRKDGMRIVTADDAREAVRGTTAIVDGGRLTYALWKLHEEAAKPICDQLAVPFEPGCLVRGAVVKANDEADYTAHTYHRQESGLLVQLESEPMTPDKSEPSLSKPAAREILKEVDRRFTEGNPFSHSANSSARYLVHFLMRQHSMSRKAAMSVLIDWMNNGVVVVEVRDRKSGLQGLKVGRWL